MVRIEQMSAHLYAVDHTLHLGTLIFREVSPDVDRPTTQRVEWWGVMRRFSRKSRGVPSLDIDETEKIIEGCLVR